MQGHKSSAHLVQGQQTLPPDHMQPTTYFINKVLSAHNCVLSFMYHFWCFSATMSELILCVRYFIAPNPGNTYYLALYYKSLLAPNIIYVDQFFFNMKFIVQLVSIQHPVLIPKGALLNTQHPPSPPSHPPSTLSLFSVFNSLLCFGSLPL